MATHVIGDVHGCYRELCDLLELLGPGVDDRLIFVGDLVIRGPQNAEVVRLFTDGPLSGATVLLGNNEEKIPPTLAGDPTYASPAVLAAIEQLRSAGLLEEALALFASFPLFLDLGDVAVVHAGVRPGVPLEAQTRDDLLKIKTANGSPDGPMWWEAYGGPHRVVFGHHVLRDPLDLPNAVGIDTGCVYGGRLTAYTLETGVFTTVRAADTYYRHPGKYYLFE
jgi:serine/threonine protein phosphatase 1